MQQERVSGIYAEKLIQARSEDGTDGQVPQLELFSLLLILGGGGRAPFIGRSGAM
jgi:hypothetical protein